MTIMKTPFLSRFFEMLNEHFTYAVLRNHEGLPETISSRDIDILLAVSELHQFQRRLAVLLDETGWRILYVNRDDQFWTVVLGADSAAKEIEPIQIDIMFSLSVMGIVLLDEKQILQARLSNGKVFFLRPQYVFLCKYVYSRILGAKYPEKYAELRRKLLPEESAAVEAELQMLAGRKHGMDFWETAGKWRLRRIALLRALLRAPFRQFRQGAAYLFFLIRNLFFRRGMMVSFSGPDGCGKTTVIELLRERLNVNPPLLFHFRPELLPNLGEVGTKAGVLKEVDRNFSRPHRAARKGRINSLLRLGYYSGDYILGYAIKVLPLRQRKHIVFFDRYFSDIIVDGERSCIFLNYRFLARLRHIVPGCQYYFFFRVDPDRILSRKQELPKEDIQRIYSRLEYLAARDRNCHWIDNNATPEEAVDQILNILLEKQHRKYVRKLQ